MEKEKEKEREKGKILDIITLLSDKKYILARTEILEFKEVDIAEIIDDIEELLGIEKAVIVFRMLPKNISAEVFSYLHPDHQLAIINEITDKETQFIMEELSFDDMIDVLEELPANLVDKILNKVPKDRRKLINKFLSYPESCAGSLMTIDYIAVKKEMTVKETLNHIKKHGMDQETIYTCYVIDGRRKLEGIVSLRKLVTSDDELKIEGLMHTDIISVNALEDQEEVASIFKKYGYLAMPVVDYEDRLVGIITVDDILDVIDEETNEDFQKMAGMSVTQEEYLDMGVFKHVWQRLPWLFFLMCSYMITGSIIAGFEDVLSKVIALVTYMPMLMGTGGNSGSQSATLIIRGMSVGDIELSDALKVLWKELRISLITGVILSSVNFARVCWLDGEGPYIALTVCGSMLFIVVAAKTIGSMLPMLAKKVGIDPALMASPMISSLTDMVSVISYFAMASLILGI